MRMILFAFEQSFADQNVYVGILCRVFNDQVMITVGLPYYLLINT